MDGQPFSGNACSHISTDEAMVKTIKRCPSTAQSDRYGVATFRFLSLITAPFALHAELPFFLDDVLPVGRTVEAAWLVPFHFSGRTPAAALCN